MCGAPSPAGEGREDGQRDLSKAVHQKMMLPVAATETPLLIAVAFCFWHPVGLRKVVARL
jgi:hypothetical protein